MQSYVYVALYNMIVYYHKLRLDTYIFDNLLYDH